MKQYIKPQIEEIEIELEDVIAASMDESLSGDNDVLWPF